MSYERGGPHKCIPWLQNKGILKIYIVKGVNNDPQVFEPGIVVLLGEKNKKVRQRYGFKVKDEF